MPLHVSLAGSAVDHRRRHRRRPHPVVTDDRARRPPRAARRVAADPAADRRAVLARLDRRAGADQPAPRAAPPAPGAGGRAVPRRDRAGPVLARHRDLPVDLRSFDRRARRGARRPRPGDAEAALAHADAALADYGGDLLPGHVRRLAARRPRGAAGAQCVDLCDLRLRDAGRAAATWPGRGCRPAPDPAGSRWRRPATAP